jgi:hypothetical protein
MGNKGALAIVFGLVTPLFGCGAVDSGVTSGLSLEPWAAQPDRGGEQSGFTVGQANIGKDRKCEGR